MFHLHQFSGLNQKAVEFILNIDWRNCPDLNEIFPYIVHRQGVELFAEGCCEC